MQEGRGSTDRLASWTLPKSTVHDRRRYGELTTVRVVVATRLSLRVKMRLLVNGGEKKEESAAGNAAAYLMTSVRTLPPIGRVK